MVCGWLKIDSLVENKKFQLFCVCPGCRRALDRPGRRSYCRESLPDGVLQTTQATALRSHSGNGVAHLRRAERLSTDRRSLQSRRFGDRRG